MFMMVKKRHPVLSLMLMMKQVVGKVTLEKPIRLSSAAIWVFVHRCGGGETNNKTISIHI